ncbi:MAG: 50S ribosomal protein L29 [Candidatus Dadabacteria bacterium]|nr:50S ribosomal protein L29 [Candidatus Dadabacteria bacterium]MXZ13601.1 50S ribosomal protein L29 [Candidatus Dadabacteria bacterium]MYA48325.1 50S ribosomal protein L29 [Candidatus Dadabacteria bacterium]MYC39990.1 50S ribosomal protein L29 [Candidatus Dadabacteria bacterium]MYF47429.1 50S ribosomal protein L29 [Candidatus Dadabacteria bacterium]
MATNTEELRNLTPEELSKRHRDAAEELFNVRIQVATGQNSNNARIKQLRREIARILTIKKQRDIVSGS